MSGSQVHFVRARFAIFWSPSICRLAAMFSTLAFRKLLESEESAHCVSDCSNSISSRRCPSGNDAGKHCGQEFRAIFSFYTSSRFFFSVYTSFSSLSPPPPSSSLFVFHTASFLFLLLCVAKLLESPPVIPENHGAIIFEKLAFLRNLTKPFDRNGRWRRNSQRNRSDGKRSRKID